MSLTDLAPVSSSISNTMRRRRHLERRSEGHAALATLVDVILRLFEFVANEFELRGAREIVDRKHRAENRLQAFVQPSAGRLIDHQELVIGRLLNLDEVRHLGDFLICPKNLRTRLRPVNVCCVCAIVASHFAAQTFPTWVRWRHLPECDGHRPRVEFQIVQATVQANCKGRSLGLTASELQAAENPAPNLKTQNDARGAGGALPSKPNPTAC